MSTEIHSTSSGPSAKVCQNCKASFEIDASDFVFYEKIKVPPPTFCPECRFLRRTLWRNDRILHKRIDDRTGKSIFSMFSPAAPIKVWERDDWWSDELDPVSYGRDYDFSYPFFEQFNGLIQEVPWASRSVYNLVRSDYCMNANDLKDCYLVFGSGYTEDSYYGLNLSYSQNCFDSSYITESQLCYEGFFNQKCFNALFSSHCENSHDIVFCKNCVGVSNCFGCVDLKNKSYHVFNKPYSKEEYQKKIQKFDLGSYGSLNALKSIANEFWAKYPVKFLDGYHNSDVSGEYISNSRNVKQSYHIDQGENLKFCQSLYFNSAKDSYDHFRFGNNSELIYESAICGIGISRLKFCYDCYSNCSNLTYSMMCHSASSLFGCVGLRNKQYCILNKQYTKEEYEKLIPKIIKHMNDMPYIDKKERVYKYGEFFPPDFSPFAYNETIAQEFFPLTKEESEHKGYIWRNPEEKAHVATIKSEELPDHISQVDDLILNQTIGCTHKNQCSEQCVGAFKIVARELAFYKKNNLALPRLCPNCRHAQRLLQRNHIRLWPRGCQCTGSESGKNIYINQVAHFHSAGKCPNEFETSYAPDRPEIVYCEQCYNAEVA